jgi:hypothetical protein
MEKIMSNSSKNEKAKLTSNRELTADQLNQVTGGMGPVFIYSMASSTYTKQKPDGTAGGNVVGGWDLTFSPAA